MESIIKRCFHLQLKAQISSAFSSTRARARVSRRVLVKVAAVAFVLVLGLSLSGCATSAVGAGSNGFFGSWGQDLLNFFSDHSSGKKTSAEAFEVPELRLTSYNDEAAQKGRGCSIDASHAEDGYIMAAATSENGLKLSMICNGKSNYFDMPNNGKPAAFPLLNGNGNYLVRIMENIGGNNYIQLFSLSCTVNLSSDLAPYLRPNAFCDYNETSACVALAKQLVANASSQVEAANAIYSWVSKNISYNKTKAEELTKVTGYLPNPDETLAAKSGICFDYASLTAAMMRSVGIPTKIVTGYVTSTGIYHAWNMVYLDGRWVTNSFVIDANQWGRIDTTFAAAGMPGIAADGEGYEDKFTY